MARHGGSRFPFLADAAPGMGSMGLDPTGSVGTVRRVPLVWSADKQLYPSSPWKHCASPWAKSFVVLGDTLGQGTIDALRVGSIQVPTNADGRSGSTTSVPSPISMFRPRTSFGDDYTKTSI